jgi:hypothetical protein
VKSIDPLLEIRLSAGMKVAGWPNSVAGRYGACPRASVELFGCEAESSRTFVELHELDESQARRFAILINLILLAPGEELIPKY